MLALALGLLIVFVVVAGSMWIMADLNDNMLMPSAHLMDRANRVSSDPNSSADSF